MQAPLSGLLVEPSVATQTPIAIVVENHPDARPQSGLNNADLVFETFAEGGITRFLAIYQSQADPQEIGPVRSARPYFVEWAQSYNAFFAHVGGSSDGLALIKKLNVFDINQFGFAGSFWRDSKRYAPHNVYTTLAKLRQAAASRKYQAQNTSLTAFTFKTEPKLEARPQANSFRVIFNNLFAVTYSYAPQDNYYYRAIAGTSQKDRPTGAQVRAKNVVVCYSDFSNGFSSTGEKKVNIRTTGTGKASFFVDGVRTEGSWTRGSGSAIKFLNADGSELKLNPGTTWVDFVPQATVVK